MTPLQKIAMGLVIVIMPANFPRNPNPDWRFYDALPDPIGWLLVLAGVIALRGTITDNVLLGLTIAAFTVSVPLWFPQLNQHFVHPHPSPAQLSLQWALSLPQTVFCAWLARRLGAAGGAAGDRFVSGRFAVLATGFWTLAVLPAVVYGAATGLADELLIVIGLVQIVFVYYLFRAHRREFLGGPTPSSPHPS